MEISTNMLWDVGKILSNVCWNEGESLQSPVLSTADCGSWWLDFFPVGDSENSECLVFCLHRSSVAKDVEAVFKIHLCFHSTPVRQYTLQHLFVRGEDVYKWVIDDVKNLAQLKIYVPLPTLCIAGYLTVLSKDVVVDY